MQTSDRANASNTCTFAISRYVPLPSKRHFCQSFLSFLSTLNSRANWKPNLVVSGYPVVNDPLYNHDVFGPEKGKGGRIGKSDEDLIQDLISIHNAENWLGMDQDDLIICNPTKKVTVTHHQQPSSQPPPQRADTPDSAVAISDHSPSSSSPASDFQVRLPGKNIDF